MKSKLFYSFTEKYSFPGAENTSFKTVIQTDITRTNGSALALKEQKEKSPNHCAAFLGL